MMADIRVRTAEVTDVRSVATVHVESWRSTNQGLVPDDQPEALSVTRRVDVWRDLIEEVGDDSGVLVLEPADGDLVGFCHFGPSRDDNAPTGTGEVASIYLLEDHRGRGGSTQLMSAASAAMVRAGYHRAYVWVLDTNEPARRFYEKLGWVRDDAVKVVDRGSFQLREVRYTRPL